MSQDTPKAGGGAELLPCPFCGLDLVWEEQGRGRSRARIWHHAARDTPCAAQSFGCWDGDEDRRAAWNTRAPSPAPLATGGEVDWRPAVAVAERHGAKWRKRAEKHVRPGGYRSEHQQHDLARAQICDHIAADIRALSTSPTRVGDGGLRAHIEAALETIRTRHAEERAEADAGQLGTIKVANSGGRRDGLREAGDLIRAALRAADAGGGDTAEKELEALEYWLDDHDVPQIGDVNANPTPLTIVGRVEWLLERAAQPSPTAGGRGDEGVGS